MSKEIAIVDYDCLTSAGADTRSTWDRLSANGSGVRAIDRYSPQAESFQGVADISYAAQIPMTYGDLAGSSDRYEKWPEPGLHAIRLLADRIFGRMGFNIAEHDPQRIGLLGGTALTSQISQDLVTRTGRAGTKFILHHCHNTPLAAAASVYGIQGPSFSVSSACASSGHALFLAGHLINAGVIDAALVVGFEFPVLPICVGGFEWLKALYRRDDPADRAWSDSTAASRPFSQDRRGFLLGEGAGAVFVASPEYARKAGWPIQATVRGAYVNSDGGHLTRISPQNIRRCMTSALADAQCNREDIGAINAHATSTLLGDQAELQALAEVFGDTLPRIPISANKSQIGHSLGASLILGLILAVEAIRHGVVLPTLNHVADERLPAAWIPPTAVAHEHHFTLINSFGFGGTNVSLVLANGKGAES